MSLLNCAIIDSFVCFAHPRMYLVSVILTWFFQLAFLPAIVSSTQTDKKPLFRCVFNHSHPGIIHHPSSEKTSASFRSHIKPASGCPYKFLANGTTRSVMLSHVAGLRDRGMCIQITGHSPSGNLNNFGASSIFTGVYAETASLASPAHSGSREITSTQQSCAMQRNLVQ